MNKIKSLIQKISILFFIICALFNSFEVTSKGIDFEKIDKEVEEAIKTENRKIEELVTLKPKETSNLFK
jgi:hypothetical protein